MPYRFETEKKDYSDYSAGQFFHSTPHQTAFPVRLSSEIFLRCQALLEKNGRFPPYTIYDPCVGGGYHLVTLAYLHWQNIDCLIGADISQKVLVTTQKNFSLLNENGVAKRIEEISTLYTQFGKSSHHQNLRIASRFRDMLIQNSKTHEIKTAVFQADTLSYSETIKTQLAPFDIDLVLTDVPYGAKTSWEGEKQTQSNPLWHLLDTLKECLNAQAIVAIASDKSQKAEHASFHRVSQFKLGKRKVMLFEFKNG